jgi:ribosome recycling factor
MSITMTEEVKFTLSLAEDQMKKTISHAQRELLKIRAGKANPNMLDSILVDYYGAETPLDQVANVTTPDAQTLAIQPWEKTMIEPIERAIMEAHLGLNPQNDGALIRINIPPLTEERRMDLVKQAKNESENCKISIRNSRKEANDEIKKLSKDGLAEDAVKDAEADIQDLTNKYIKIMDDHMEIKEKEITTV